MLGMHNLRLDAVSITDAIVRFTSACGMPRFILAPLERLDDALAIAAGLPHRQNGLERPLEVIPLPAGAAWGLANHGNTILHQPDGPETMTRQDDSAAALAAAATPAPIVPPPAPSPQVHEDPPAESQIDEAGKAAILNAV